MAKPVMDPDHPEYSNDDFEDDIERCPHGAPLSDDFEDDDEELDELDDEALDDIDEAELGEAGA